MYSITIDHVTQIHEFEELIKIFLDPGNFKIINNGTITDDLKTLAGAQRTDESNGPEAGHKNTDSIEIKVPEALSANFHGAGGRNAIKQYLFQTLRQLTGVSPDWGIHTGVRPVKLMFELVESEGSVEAAKKVLLDYYLMSEEKVDLLTEIYGVQKKAVQKSQPTAKGIYIGIPFCPTRCVYCSFPSNQGSDEDMERYMEALLSEIAFVGSEMGKKGWYPETLYIGGGTPTALSHTLLETLLNEINRVFDLEKLREFTLEAGRPDTITKEKLTLAKDLGVTRISINPQSMKADTLKAIGRDHSPEDIRSAFALAKMSRFSSINADLIAGLPDEMPEDFSVSLEEVINLGAENITVHTLAMKRASRLAERDALYHRRQGHRVREMLEMAEKTLKAAGYVPYYLYRQKQMTGNFENVGWGKPGTENLYNIRIMEEAQTIIALGAGGISKVYYPSENRLERVPNVSNYEIYIERIQGMKDRKAIGIFSNEKNDG